MPTPPYGRYGAQHGGAHESSGNFDGGALGGGLKDIEAFVVTEEVAAATYIADYAGAGGETMRGGGGVDCYGRGGELQTQEVL